MRIRHCSGRRRVTVPDQFAVAPYVPHAVIGYGVDRAVLCRRLECESFARLEADALQRHVDLRADDAVVVADHELRRPERIRPLAATLRPNRATATSPVSYTHLTLPTIYSV